jgi:branched-subunit amino acid ABC-type transport system permease component
MNSVIVFAILGASAGALYALASLGIVLTFRGSGVINFASGAMGMIGAFIFYLLRDQHSVPAGIAAVAGIAVAAGLGYGTHLLMLPLKAASNLTRIVVTLALMVVLIGAIDEGSELPRRARRGQPTAGHPDCRGHRGRRRSGLPLDPLWAGDLRGGRGC